MDSSGSSRLLLITESNNHGIRIQLHVHSCILGHCLHFCTQNTPGILCQIFPFVVTVWKWLQFPLFSALAVESFPLLCFIFASSLPLRSSFTSNLYQTRLAHCHSLGPCWMKSVRRTNVSLCQPAHCTTFFINYW